MPVYTHARQFPHLAGMTDTDIRELARRAMARRPNLVRILRLRNVVVCLSMFAVASLLSRGSGPGIGDSLRASGSAMMIAGAGGTAALLIWNMIWVNTVIFRLSREEVDRMCSTRSGREAPGMRLVRQGSPRWEGWQARWEGAGRSIELGLTALEADADAGKFLVWESSTIKASCRPSELLAIWEAIQSRCRGVWLDDEQCRLWSPQSFAERFGA